VTHHGTNALHLSSLEGALDDAEGLSTGIMVAIIIGIVAILLIFGLSLVCCCRKKGKGLKNNKTKGGKAQQAI
jgi:hypothetical protein